MNKLSKEQWLAEKVMGFSVSTHWRNGGSSNCIVYSKIGYEVSEDGWEPSTNIEQAFMLLDGFEFKSLVWIIHSDVWQVEVGNMLDELGLVREKTVSKAITEVVLKASGYYNE